MMANARAQSMLPAIKCSNCGVEIEISKMGDHLCKSQARGMPKHSPVLPSTTFGRRPANTKSERVHLKPSKTINVPPRIDPSAANRPYVQRNLLAPLSNASSGGRSPVSPMDRPSPARSMTSPMPRFHRPASPELSSNLDCAFPAWPTSRPSTSGSPSLPAQSQKDMPSAKFDQLVYSEPESIAESSGAEIDSAVGLDKVDTLSAHAQYRSQGVTRNVSAPEHRSNSTQPSWTSRSTSRGAGPAPSASLPAQQAHVLLPATSYKPSAKVAQPNGTLGTTNVSARSVPSRPQRPGDVDGFLVQLREEPFSHSEPALQPLRSDARSNTFPTPRQPQQVGGNGAAPNIRRPSEPTYSAGRPPLAHAAISAPSNVHQASQAPVYAQTLHNPTQTTRSRSASRAGIRPDMTVGNAPSLPSIPSVSSIRQEHGTHAPSDSASSTSSSGSTGASSNRSHTSPMTSASSSVSLLSATVYSEQKDRALPPSASNHSLQSQTSQHQARDRDYGLGLTVPAQQESHPWTPPARAYAPLSAPKSETRKITPPNLRQHLDDPESPMDPSMQRDHVRQPDIPRNTPSDAYNVQPIAPHPNKDESVRLGTPSANNRRPATASKHVCRGCDQHIVGKSIKDAHGRLTGRYHKDCFVCKTCRATFATADFYVIENNPYCEHHYHKLNGSLCTNCDRGIEGEYLETQQSEKFHPHCLTCQTCRTILSDDYFEISGQVYCERHAFAAVRSQGGLGPKRDMERRTTRLLMM